MTRVRDRSNKNPTCKGCGAPMVYEPGQYTRQRCAPCTKVHNNKRDQITAHKKDVKQWAITMTQTVRRIGPT